MTRFLLLFSVLIILNASAYAQKKVIPNNPDYEFQSEKQNKQTQNTQQSTTSTTSVYTNSRPTFQPRWSFGGNVGLSFWNGGGNVLIAPKAYYHFSPMVFTGFGLTYMYSKGTNYYNYTSNSVNSFGGSVMMGFRPIQFLQVTATYEGLSTHYSGSYNDSFWNNALYLGASFVSGNVAFGFHYDVLYNADTSPYSSAWGPVVSFYF